MVATGGLDIMKTFILSSFIFPQTMLMHLDLTAPPF